MECPLRITLWNTESPALRLKNKSMFNKSAFLIFRLKAIVSLLAASLLLSGCSRKPVAAVAEPDEPFSKFGRHLFDRSADFGVHGQQLYALSDRSSRAPRCIPVFRC